MRLDKYGFDLDYLPEGHTNPEKIAIGTINFNESIEEAQVGNPINIKKIGECKIEVYPNEGQIPHFHMFNANKSFDTCICIHSSHYFSHGGKYRDKLNSSQCKQLDNFLSGTTEQGLNIWAFIVAIWESMNPDCKFPKNRKAKKKPDYTRLINFNDG